MIYPRVISHSKASPGRGRSIRTSTHVTTPHSLTTDRPTMQQIPEFSDDQLLVICEIADVIACECPARLVGLLREVRKFRQYTLSCIEKWPESTEMHEWLAGEIAGIEDQLTTVMYEFMAKENLLNEQGYLDMDRLAELSYEASLRQLYRSE